MTPIRSMLCQRAGSAGALTAGSASSDKPSSRHLATATEARPTDGKTSISNAKGDIR